YDLSNEYGRCDITRFLLSEKVIVNDSPPSHPPLISGTGRFVYVVGVHSKQDVKSAKADYSGDWNRRKPGMKIYVEHSEKKRVEEYDGKYVKSKDGSTILKILRQTKPVLPRLQRLITVVMDLKEEPKGRMVIEYIYSEPGDVLLLSEKK
ncbi:hypothetical protein PFISCL1PPCAC_12467, partial [Pristionchus fissidentatus]